MSLTCRASGLDLARGGSVWLDFALLARIALPRRERAQTRFGLVFNSIRCGSARRGFADLENRQRRKSLVGKESHPIRFSEWLLSRARRHIPPLRPFHGAPLLRHGDLSTTCREAAKSARCRRSSGRESPGGPRGERTRYRVYAGASRRCPRPVPGTTRRFSLKRWRLRRWPVCPGSFREDL